LDLYYSDTDSLVLNGALPAEVCDSARLGQLKLEHTFIEGIFVMPKVYFLETSEGDIITRCKGYPGKLTRNQYLELLEGNSLELDVIRWNRSLRASKIPIERGIPYRLTPSFNKRVKVYDSNGRWVNTNPRILNLKERGDK
jgi:hypothetical protein